MSGDREDFVDECERVVAFLLVTETTGGNRITDKLIKTYSTYVPTIYFQCSKSSTELL